VFVSEQGLTKFAPFQIGECTMKISTLCVGTGIDEWYAIYYKGKQSGQVHLKSTWTPSRAAPTGQHPQAATHPNGGVYVHPQMTY